MNGDKMNWTGNHAFDSICRSTLSPWSRDMLIQSHNIPIPGKVLVLCNFTRAQPAFRHYLGTTPFSLLGGDVDRILRRTLRHEKLITFTKCHDVRAHPPLPAFQHRRALYLRQFVSKADRKLFSLHLNPNRPSLL